MNFRNNISIFPSIRSFEELEPIRLKIGGVKKESAKRGLDALTGSWKEICNEVESQDFLSSNLSRLIIYKKFYLYETTLHQI